MSEDGHGLGGRECLGPEDAENADVEGATPFFGIQIHPCKNFVFYTNEIGIQEASKL